MAIKQIPKESYFAVHVMRDEGETGEKFFIGMIHDLDLALIDQFSEPNEIDGLVDSIKMDDIEWPEGSWMATYRISHLSWDDGEYIEGMCAQRAGWDYQSDFVEFIFSEVGQPLPEPPTPETTRG